MPTSALAEELYEFAENQCENAVRFRRADVGIGPYKFYLTFIRQTKISQIQDEVLTFVTHCQYIMI